MGEFPTLLHTVIDTTDVRGLAEFYRELLGLRYRPGDERPAAGEPDDADWLVLTGGRRHATARVPGGARAARARPGPATTCRCSCHLDLTVPDAAALERQRERAESLGAVVLLDRTDDDDEPLYVLADPSGHPFCVFVG